MIVLSRRSLLVGVTAIALAKPTIALAETHEVEMLNVHPEDSKQRMVFLPRVLTIQPGDTVKFVATDRSHNSASIEEMVPDGFEGWRGGLNEEVEITFEQPGFYGYDCIPHRLMGMVGLIIVEGEGMHDNLEAAMAVQHRGRAKTAWEEIWAQVEADGHMNE